MTIAKLEPLARDYNARCIELDAAISMLEAALDHVKTQFLADLKRLARAVARAEAELRAAIESNPELFNKPRTLVIHGTKLGYTTSKGKVTFEDEAQVVKLVRKHFTERFDELVQTKESARKDNLRALSTAELAKLGCTIEGAGDVVVLSRVDGDVEKLMDKLIEKLVVSIVESK